MNQVLWVGAFAMFAIGFYQMQCKEPDAAAYFGMACFAALLAEKI